MSQRFQLNLRTLIAATAALALLLAYCMLPEDAQSAYVRWFVIPVFGLPPLVLLLFLPAWWLANKLAQSLLGRLPPDELKDAEPIPLEVPPSNDDG